MRLHLIAALPLLALGAACAKPEPVSTVYVQPTFDKFGNVVNGTIVDGVFILSDGTVVGPVDPAADNGNRNRNRTQTQTQTQVQTQAQTQAQQRGGI